MTAKEKFISEISNLITTNPLSDEAMQFFNGLKEEKLLTKKGAEVLKLLQNQDKDYIFTAKMLSENINMNTRSISGTMRKLLNDGFVEKIGSSTPISYRITEKGFALDLDNIENK